MKVEVHCTNGRVYQGTLHDTDTSHIFVKLDGKLLALHWDWVEKAYRLTKEGKKPMSIQRYRRRS
jgi:hypothetical protein